MTEIEFETPEAAEAFDLMMQLFEGCIDAKGMLQLDLALRRDAFVRKLFIRVAHQYCALVPFIAVQGQQEPPTLEYNTGDSDKSGLAANLLSETMILPALPDLDDPDEDQDQSGIFQPIPFQPEILQNQPRHIYRWMVRVASVIVLALMVAATVLITRQHPQKIQQAIHRVGEPVFVSATAPSIIPEPPPATITATAGARASGLDIINPRTEMVLGRTLKLAEGDVELTFGIGATVVIRGPAQFRVTDRNTLTVDTGSVYAHVPPSAIGFRILSPGLEVVDRGTNFGVRAIAIDPASGVSANSDSGSGSSSSEVHVFEGRVDATALDGAGNQSSPPLPVKAGDAVAHSALSSDLSLKPVRFQASAFDPDINRIQLTVRSHGTGAGVEAGKTDPQWQLISIPNAPDWKPVPAAVVIDPRPEYFPNSAKANWLSTAPHMDYVAGGDYIYRTNIDLTGLDPKSVSVVANFAVDDSIREIRVNGQPVPLPKELTLGLDRTVSRTTLHQLVLSDAKWLNGPNRVDVVVWNLTGDNNFTGLQLFWSILATPVVMR